MNIRLNLGAGDNIRSGWVNHDVMPHPGIAVVHDLDLLPWPWGNDSALEIVAWAVFEHLHLRLSDAVEECWRVMCVGGVLRLKVPKFMASTVADDPQHVHMGWNKATFDFFDPRRGLYGKRGKMYRLGPWRVVQVASIVNGNAWSVIMEKEARA